jgi:hypothetical protein
MAAFVSPQHQAVLNEMDRIVAGADSHAPVLEQMMFEQRWQAEQHTRSWAALKGVHGGVKIAKNHESLSASCNTCSTFCMGYTYQPSSGHWFLKKFAVHEAGCFGAQTPADGATAVESARRP